MIEKANYKGDVKETSYETGSSSHGTPDYNPNYPGPIYASTNRFPVQVPKDPVVLTNTRTQSRIPPHALDPHMSRDELIKKLNQHKALNISETERLSVSDSSLSIQHTDPVVSRVVIPPVSQVLTNGVKREDRYPSNEFVEIIANGSYSYAVYTPPTVTTSTEYPSPTWLPIFATSTTSTTTESYAESFTTEAVQETTTTATTTSTTGYQFRKPPKHVNALNVVESPMVIVNGSESQIVEHKTPSEHKFSKLVSIEEPPELVQARLEREKRKKQKEAQERLLSLMALQQQQKLAAMTSKGHQHYHDKYHHQAGASNSQQPAGAAKFIQYFYQRNPFSAPKKQNAKYQTSSSEVSQVFGGSNGLTGSKTPLIQTKNPYASKLQPSGSVITALQSSLGYGFPSPTSSNNPFNPPPSNYGTVNAVASMNSILKSGTQAGKSVLNKLASYRPLQMMLPSMKNFKFLPPTPVHSMPSMPSSNPLLSTSLFPLSHPLNHKKLKPLSFQGMSSGSPMTQQEYYQSQQSMQSITKLLDPSSSGNKDSFLTPDKMLASWILQQTANKGKLNKVDKNAGNSIALSSLLSVLPSSGVKSNLNNNDVSNFLLSAAASAGIEGIPSKRSDSQSSSLASQRDSSSQAVKDEGNQRYSSSQQKEQVSTTTTGNSQMLSTSSNNIDIDDKHLYYDASKTITPPVHSLKGSQESQSEEGTRVNQSFFPTPSLPVMQIIPMTQPIITSTPSNYIAHQLSIVTPSSRRRVKDQNYVAPNLGYDRSQIKRVDNSLESNDEANIKRQDFLDESYLRQGSTGKKAQSHKTLNDESFQPEKDSLIPNLIQETSSSSHSSHSELSNQPPSFPSSSPSDFFEDDEETTTKYSQPLVVKSNSPPVSLFEALLKSLWIADHWSRWWYSSQTWSLVIIESKSCV